MNNNNTSVKVIDSATENIPHKAIDGATEIYIENCKSRELNKKNYIIWLDSGECIDGTATKDECLKLKEAYCNFKKGKAYGSYKCYEIKDDDGTAWVDFNKVQAIAINKCIKNKKLGFKS